MTINLVEELLLPMPPDRDEGNDVVLSSWVIELMVEAENRIRSLEMCHGVTDAAARNIQVLEWSTGCTCDTCRVAEAALAGETGAKDPVWRAFETLMQSLLKLSPTPAVAARPKVLDKDFGALLEQIENLVGDAFAKGGSINNPRRLHLPFLPPGTPVLMNKRPKNPLEITP